MRILIYISIVFLILFAFYGYIVTKREAPLELENFKQKKETDDELLEQVLTDIENNKDKREWITFTSQTYPFTLLKNNKPYLTTEIIKKENGTVDINIMKDDNKVLIAHELKPYSGDYKGTINSKPFTLEYRQRTERLTIRYGKHKELIIGHGINSTTTSLPHPWHELAPIVFKKVNNPIGIIYYDNDPLTLPRDTKQLPLEFSIPKEEEKMLPLFFLSYITLHELLKDKNIFN